MCGHHSHVHKVAFPSSALDLSVGLSLAQEKGWIVAGHGGRKGVIEIKLFTSVQSGFPAQDFSV